MIMHGDAERRANLDDRLRHLDVGRRRRRIAGGVVVHQNNRGRREFEGALDDFARIDRRMVDRADLLTLVGNQAVALVEKQDANPAGLLASPG